MAGEADKDGPTSPQPVQSIEVDRQVKHEEDADGASDHDTTVARDGTNIETNDDKVSNDLYKAFKAITEALLNFKIQTKSNEDYYPSGLFKRLPNKRILPEYYEVIKEPSAISTLRGKIQRKSYTGVPEFVRDFALIVHNAQIFNRPNSQPVRDILQLEEIFKEELKKLVEQGLVSEDDTKFPDLGEIPYATPEPDPISEDEEEEDGEAEAEDDDEEEEEDDEEIDESDDEKRGRKRRGRPGKVSGINKKQDEDDEDEKVADAESKRRGRPPKVATPTEHRIDKILKSLKRPRSKDGTPMILPFERLPDKADLPDYYRVIPEPIAYDTLKKKAKRKKYTTVEHFMKDVELMFNNAMTFNEDGSDIYNFAQELLAEARKVEAEEQARPDSEYLQATDGRIPLPFITYKNETWKVGDWVHLQNPNDVTKPIIAQIYRTWKTNEGEEWINACWYYRPEQTVHQYEKHFFPNEVVKTGQYRDHRVEELVDKCFVMFYTRFNRGRPRGIREGAEVYVCEARYNEDKFKFNKIKTWASCLPDEVRDKDYEMDMFDTPRRIKKVPSPLKHLLKDNMKDTDELPQPQWGHPNAPPQVGGIHKHPRDENQSPPPEPTPPPQPAPPSLIRPPTVSMTSISPQPQPSIERQSSSGFGNQPHMARPSVSSTTPQPIPYQGGSVAPPPNQYNRQQGSGATPTPYQSTPQPSQGMGQHQPPPYVGQHQPYSTPMGAAHPGTYMGQTPMPSYGRPPTHNVQHAQYGTYPPPNNAIHRVSEAYVLSDAANESIPKDVRDQFPQDDQGRVLFFTQPPLDTRHIVSGSSDGEKGKPLQHSEKYIDALSLRKRKLDDIEFGKDGHERQTNGHPPEDAVPLETNRPSMKESEIEGGEVSNIDATTAKVEKKKLQDWFDRANINHARMVYGKDWNDRMAQDQRRTEERMAAEHERQRLAEKRRNAFRGRDLQRLDSNLANLNKQGYLKDWRKDFFTGAYQDDHDPRLPF